MNANLIVIRTVIPVVFVSEIVRKRANVSASMKSQRAK